MNFKEVQKLLLKRTYEEAKRNAQYCIICDKFKDGCCSLEESMDKYHEKVARGYCDGWDRNMRWTNFLTKSSRIKLVIYSSALLCGGAERWLVSLASSLDPKIFKICVAIKYGHLVDADLFQKLKKVEFIVFGNKDIEKVTRKADILLTWDSFPTFKTARKVFCSHGCDALNLELVRGYGDRDDYIFTAVSDMAACIWRNKNPQVLFNGCELSRLTPSKGRRKARKELGVSDDTVLIGYVSRLISEKNPYLVAEAARKLRERGAPAQALFVGVPNPEAGIKDLAMFLPKQEFVGDIYAAIDCFMLPSNSEAFSLAIIEAWLTGTPVVTTNVGAIPELTEQYGELAVILDDFEKADMAVLKAISPEFQPTVSYAFRLAEEHFTEERMVERWSNYLQSII
jgi:glycosyltransferase involved in cell wall biosynthesis